MLKITIIKITKKRKPKKKPHTLSSALLTLPFYHLWNKKLAIEPHAQTHTNPSTLPPPLPPPPILSFFLNSNEKRNNYFMLSQGAVCWVSVCSWPSMTYAVNVRIFKVHVLTSLSFDTQPRLPFSIIIDILPYSSICSAKLIVIVFTKL